MIGAVYRGRVYILYIRAWKNNRVFRLTSWVFCSVLFLNTKRYILYECLQCWVLLTYVRLQYHWVWKPLNLSRSISLLASVHVIRTSIIELGMFTNLCLVLPLLLARSLVLKFLFQLAKRKSWSDTRKMVGYCTNWQMAWPF